MSTTFLSIGNRLRPFSHQPGTCCVLPRSSCKATVFPTRCEVATLDEKKRYTLDFALQGPIEDFTVMLDLEKDALFVHGKASLGFFCYRLQASEEGISLVLERAQAPLQVSLDGGNFSLLDKKKSLFLTIHTHYRPLEAPSSQEILSFGNHQSQEWEVVIRRRQLSQLLPLWFALGSKTPDIDNAHLVGTLSFLERLQTLQDTGNPESLGDLFILALSTAFETLLFPKVKDDLHLGLALPEGDVPQEAALLLLSRGAKLIKSLLVKESPGMLTPLPCLPQQLHCGRYLNVACQGFILDMEWTKKTLRLMRLRPEHDLSLTLDLPASLRSFRLRGEGRDRGTRMKSTSPLALQAGKTYFVDRFE